LFANSPALAFIALVVAVAGPLSGIALINSVGNLSGWLGPSVVGWLTDVTGKTSTGLYVVAGFEALAAVLILLFMPRSSHRASGAAPKSEL
jgi:MFS-type transporter involved in bile tolerance (Atg22 family)